MLFKFELDGFKGVFCENFDLIINNSLRNQVEICYSWLFCEHKLSEI